MKKKEWIFLCIAFCLALGAISLFGKGYGYYTSIWDEFLYVGFMGDIIKVTTIEELNKYAYSYMALSIIPGFIAIYLYRRFLKIVPEREV